MLTKEVMLHICPQNRSRLSIILKSETENVFV